MPALVYLSPNHINLLEKRKTNPSTKELDTFSTVLQDKNSSQKGLIGKKTQNTTEQMIKCKSEEDCISRFKYLPLW